MKILTSSAALSKRKWFKCRGIIVPSPKCLRFCPYSFKAFPVLRCCQASGLSQRRNSESFQLLMTQAEKLIVLFCGDDTLLVRMATGSNCGRGPLRATVSAKWNERQLYRPSSAWVNSSYSEPWVLFSISQPASILLKFHYRPSKVLRTEGTNVDTRETFATPTVYFTVTTV